MLGRSDLIARVVEELAVSRSAVTPVVDAWEKAIIGAVAQGEAVRLPGFLSVEVVDRPERSGRNPRTGEALIIAASKGVKVTAGSSLKAAAKEVAR